MSGLPETIAIMLTAILAVYGVIISAFAAGLCRLLKQPRNQVPGTAPFVSVIIPVRNEHGHLQRLLTDLLGQDYLPGSFEVIVADDHSEDDTMRIAALFSQEHPGFPLVCVGSPDAAAGNAGKKMAIGRAIAVAKGEILLFTDADTRRGAGWISSMAASFSSPAIRMVLGPVHYTREKSVFQKIQSLEFLGLMGTTAGSAALGMPVMCNGANLAYQKDAFVQTGGFDKNQGYRSGDDMFIMQAVRAHYGASSILFNADAAAAVDTDAEPALAGFIQQRMRWVSKSSGYRDPLVVGVGLVTYLVHLGIFGGIILGCFVPELLPAVILLWIAKILLEYPLVWMMMRFFRKKELAGYYFWAQLFQLVYVPVIGMVGLILPYRWKGRKQFPGH